MKKISEKNFFETEKEILELQQKAQYIKEEKIIELIINVIVSSTLKEYYETSNTISKIQPTRTK